MKWFTIFAAKIVFTAVAIVWSGLCVNPFVFFAAGFIVVACSAIGCFVAAFAAFTYPEFQTYLHNKVNWERRGEVGPEPEEPEFARSRIMKSGYTAMFFSCLAILNVVTFVLDGPYELTLEVNMVVAALAYVVIHFVMENAVGPFLESNPTDQ